jgi:hypothetical protein
MRTDGGRSADAQAELHDAPPFLSWRAIYVLVLAALAANIALAAALTARYG